jgi:hydrogenase maturation protease
LSAPDVALRATVIGCGNTLRGDDGAGITAIRLLREQLGAARLGLAGLELVESGCPGPGIIDLLRDCHVALIVDTIVGGASPGTIHHCDSDELGAAGHQRLRLATFSSHYAGLASAIAIGRVLFPDQLPPSVSIWGIEPESVRFGEGLSAPVAAALPALVSCVRHDLSTRIKLLVAGQRKTPLRLAGARKVVEDA